MRLKEQDITIVGLHLTQGTAMPSNEQDSIENLSLNAVACRRIPYLPLLRSYCGNSILASLLLQQLEYWFQGHPQGFYKFLRPCDHPRYTRGDAWVEELAITAHEFRSAFDKIGCRYKSKKQWQSMRHQQHDPFQNRFYCSYLDVRSGLTYYQRHAIRVDELFAAVLQKNRTNKGVFERQPIDFSRDAKSASPEIKILHFQRLKNCISGSKKSASPIKETKMNYREDTEKTAAMATRKQSVGEETKPTLSKNTVAAGVDNEIAETLTTTQQAHLDKVVAGLLSYCNAWNAKTLQEGIAHSLCDGEAYTHAGFDFFKKLNTIQKAIRAGTWTLPVALTEKQQKSAQHPRAQLQQQWRELHGEYAHLQRLATLMQQKGESHVEQNLQQQVDRCCDRLRQVEAALSVN